MTYWLPRLGILGVVGALVIGLGVMVPLSGVWGDELDVTTKNLEQKQAELKKAQVALEAAKAKEASLQGGVAGLQAQLGVAEAEAEVSQRQADAALADFDRQEAILTKEKAEYVVGMRSLYKMMVGSRMMGVVSLLDANNLVEFTRTTAYQNKVLKDEQQRVVTLGREVSDLEAKKVALKKTADEAAAKKSALAAQMASLKSQIASAQYSQSANSSKIGSLNSDIKGLTAKQQQILDAKLAANNAGGSVGDSAPVSSNPAAPGFSGAYAFASYGVPHRVGMNQYGAYGRAKAGQSYSQILQAYFANVTIGTSGQVPETINVYGYGVMSLEDRYLIGIHEMPRSWSMEALKAQAVVSRSYAVANLSRIASQPQNQLNQVYHPDDPAHGDSWDQRWYQAIRETKGVILMNNGSAVSGYFSSTAGGITQQSGQVWVTNMPFLKIAEDCNGNWPNNCYDSLSPWFHKPWGDRNGKNENSTGTNCSGCNPWLTKAEMVDLLNAALVYEKNNSASGPGYDLASSTPAELASLLGSEAITDFSVIETLQDKSIGQTATVRVLGGNRGVVSLKGGSVFKAVNLRAPGTVMLNSKLFDVIRP